jgi:hypothetical protein
VKLNPVATIVAVAVLAGFSQQGVFEIPKWAFPSLPSEIPSSIKATDTTAKTLGRGSRTLTSRQILDALNPPDWYPDSHPKAPDVVLHARRDLKYAWPWRRRTPRSPKQQSISRAFARASSIA